MRIIILIVFLLIACEPEPPQPKEVEKSIVAWKFPERKPSNWIIRGTIINPIPIDELNFIFIIDVVDWTHYINLRLIKLTNF